MAKPLVNRVLSVLFFTIIPLIFPLFGGDSEKFRQVLNLDTTVALDIKYNSQQLSSPSKSPAMTPVSGPMHPVVGMPPPLPAISAAVQPAPLAHALSTGPGPAPPAPLSILGEAAKPADDAAKQPNSEFKLATEAKQVPEAKQPTPEPKAAPEAISTPEAQPAPEAAKQV